MATWPNCQDHGRRLDTCGKCLPRKFWPKGRKSCSCGQLIPKSHASCWSCAQFVETDAQFEYRKARYAAIRQVNA